MSTVINQPSTYQPESTSPEVTFLLKGIPPPSPQYVTREDIGSITSFNSATGITVEVHGRLLLPNGTVVPFVQSHTPNTDRSSKTDVFAIPEGFLLNLSVFLVAGTAKRGQCYVVVKLGRGQGTARIDHQVLLQGYVGTGVNQAWPGNTLQTPTEGPGWIHTIVGTQPAAGAEVTQVVPTGARWRIISFCLTLTSSVAVANRHPQAALLDASANLIWFTPAFEQQVNSANNITWVFGTGANPFTSVDGAHHANLLPAYLLALAGYTLETGSTNLQAADQYAAPTISVEEWIEP